ncbi:DUF4180 domain-containing protein [Streptomyces sp. RKND-216]|uniref:DUF4180 domain-containing protein n=1 Tax=Streptomyces sp. RKND-216 TaxID=2562581 RepID=UPI00109E33F1|nr:DUF4180 domain-containing protein [Streptomyces sp. RKND-216]THA23825.1 DUF4180 domain-containing protein [Streptomyces sp. RKND-216]
MSALETMHDVPVLVCDAEGAPVACVQDALDLIGDGGYQGARWVVVPVERFDEAFFRLRTRLAGEVVQKFAQYGMGLVVLGDVSGHTEASDALRDFVRECDRGHQVWFAATREELEERLAARAS